MSLALLDSLDQLPALGVVRSPFHAVQHNSVASKSFQSLTPSHSHSSRDRPCLCIRYDGWRSCFHSSHDRIAGAQINAHHLSSSKSSLWRLGKRNALQIHFCLAFSPSPTASAEHAINQHASSASLFELVQRLGLSAWKAPRRPGPSKSWAITQVRGSAKRAGRGGREGCGVQRGRQAPPTGPPKMLGDVGPGPRFRIFVGAFEAFGALSIPGARARCSPVPGWAPYDKASKFSLLYNLRFCLMHCSCKTRFTPS